MRKRKLSAKVLSGSLAAALAVSMLPVSALAATTSDDVAKIADGTYQGTATCSPDEDEDFNAYDLTLSVTVAGGAITSVDYVSTTLNDTEYEENEAYITKAFDGTKTKTGVSAQIIDANSTEDINVVSGATCTSNAIVDAVDAALAEAPEATEEEEYVYVTMNIPYDDFLDAVDADAEQAEEYTDALDGVDVVSYATSKYGISTDDEGNGVGRRVTSGTAKGTYNDGESVLGVYYAVAMDEDTYAALQDSDLTEGDDYYFTDLETEPESYLTVTYENGAYTFDASDIVIAATEEAEISGLTYTSTYGDYMFELLNVSNNGTDADGNSIGLSIDGESVTIAVEILEFSDGSSYAMYNVDNIWMGTRYNHEISWSVVGGKGYYKGHNNSSNPLYYQYTMTDYTLTAVKVVTDKGIYEYTCSQALLPYYDGNEELTVEAEDGDTEISVSVPSAWEDVMVSVSYTTGSSRNATAVYVAEEASITDGKVALTEAIDCGTNGTYTILVESSNYAPEQTTLDTPMTDAQRETLTALQTAGQEAISNAGEETSTSTLEAHLTEAEELLANTEAMSSEAGELIGELEDLIIEVRGYAYVLMNIPYDDFFNVVDADAEQAAEYTDALDGIDVVSYATSKYGISTDDEGNGVGRRVTSGTAKGTYNDGESVKGVYYAVKMDAATYTALNSSSLTEGDDYYFTAVSVTEDPDAYLTLTYSAEEDGTESYVFDAENLVTVATEEAEISGLTYTSTYGDYMFELLNVSNNGTDADGNSVGLSIDGESVTIAVEILEFSDGSSYAMYNVDNIWMGTRYNHEISWSVVGGKGYYKGHNNSSNPLYYQYTMKDYTLTAVKVVTDKGIYVYNCNLELLPYYSGDDEISVEAEDGDTEISVTVPDALEDVTVSVSYSVGSGHNVETVYIAEGVAIVDGTVALTEAINVSENGTYTILIESSNYAPTTITLDTPMTDAQRETLTALLAEGTDLLEQLEAAGLSHSLLADHVAEAEELLEAEDAMSSEAAELIGELEEYIAEAQALLSEADDSEGDTLAVRRGNTYYFQYSLSDVSAYETLSYGTSTDEVLVGDWDGDGTDTLCVRRGNRYYFSYSLKSGSADNVIYYGTSTDEVLVGDWDGDGIDTLAVRRGNQYYISNSLESGVAETVIYYGKSTDTVLVGKWADNESGTAAVKDTLAVRRGNTYYISNTLKNGKADTVLYYGKSTDEVLVGDWDNDGYDTLTVRRGNQYYVSNSLESGTAESIAVYGGATDEVYAGNWY